MTITFPRSFPISPMTVSRCVFDYTPVGGLSRALSGQVTFQEVVGGTLWELSLSTLETVDSDQYDMWHAWALSLKRGGTFKGFDPRLDRNYPLAYGAAVTSMTRAGGGAFDGTVSVTAAGGEVISLGSPLFLPANFIVTVGDYLSFTWLGGQHLVKALETKVANASGVLANLSVGPWLRTGGSVPVTATLVDPYCLMKLKPGSWKGERTGTFNPVSFEAIQTLV